LHRVKNSGLSVLVFTGYTLGEAQRQTLGAAILGHVDVLVAGRYVLSEPTGLGLLGSTNQRIHLLTARYRHTDFASIPATEVIIHRDGTVTITGIRDFQP
jgi:anaerobic ribonucleoside-triphosphate reductase activating protein